MLDALEKAGVEIASDGQHSPHPKKALMPLSAVDDLVREHVRDVGCVTYMQRGSTYVSNSLVSYHLGQ